MDDLTIKRWETLLGQLSLLVLLIMVIILSLRVNNLSKRPPVQVITPESMILHEPSNDKHRRIILTEI